MSFALLTACTSSHLPSSKSSVAVAPRPIPVAGRLTFSPHWLTATGLLRAASGRAAVGARVRLVPLQQGSAFDALLAFAPGAGCIDIDCTGRSRGSSDRLGRFTVAFPHPDDSGARIAVAAADGSAVIAYVYQPGPLPQLWLWQPRYEVTRSGRLVTVDVSNPAFRFGTIVSRGIVMRDASGRQVLRVPDGWVAHDPVDLRNAYGRVHTIAPYIEVQAKTSDGHDIRLIEDAPPTAVSGVTLGTDYASSVTCTIDGWPSRVVRPIACSELRKFSPDGPAVTADLGRPRQLTLITSHGCEWDCHLAVSDDGKHWRQIAPMQDVYDQCECIERLVLAHVDVIARFVRVIASGGSGRSSWSGLSAWSP